MIDELRDTITQETYRQYKERREGELRDRRPWWDEWRGSLDGRPTMWIKRLVAWRGWRADLHKFVSSDDPGCFHTHPAYALRVILWGGYIDQLENDDEVLWLPGDIGLVRPQLSHRVARLANGRVSYSLWIRGPIVAKVELRGEGWEKQKA